VYIDLLDAASTVVGRKQVTVELKRTIVRQFRKGRSLRAIAIDLNLEFAEYQVHEVIREFIRGKFQMEPKRKAKSHD